MPWIHSTFLFLALLLPASAQIRPLTRLGVEYRILETTPSSIRLVWADKADTPLRTFPAALKHLQALGIQPVALMNGGIFEPGGIPSGLYIENGKQLRPINPRDGKGNFFLKPNGIFFLTNDKAGVVETSKYPAKNLRVVHAVQSGPLLLQQGRTHPAFRAGSTSRLVRNGVGVSKDGGKVILAATDFHSPTFPNLYEFADLFRHLGCPDALFLDGDLSQFREGSAMSKYSNRFGSILAVVTPGEEKSPRKDTPEKP